MIRTPAATVAAHAQTEPVISNLQKAGVYLSRLAAPSLADRALAADFDTAIDLHCARMAGVPVDTGFIQRTHEAAKRVLGI
ncbi:hypothetical protein [Arthrobacter caoxuetaonis]|uniref:Uncharacterized protein n=1 Tax=Arthrobacter caoxuetaonis TaxID=2886935 RepID=A0A9X1MIH2_9MICC|nr:hypothetical protein [Arthrobacter caoxuetaonis]MCC3299820.1 hypothetical protein [Arthrobacter caoxuetaonis]USQ59280.1 hypothetical protein NF551_16990 [Arthrobacter caoxuetaonis]